MNRLSQMLAYLMTGSAFAFLVTLIVIGGVAK